MRFKPVFGIAALALATGVGATGAAVVTTLATSTAAGGSDIREVGSASGQISTDPASSIQAAAPEPTTWLMLAAGFGLVGVSMRHPKVKVARA